MWAKFSYKPKTEDRNQCSSSVLGEEDQQQEYNYCLTVCINSICIVFSAWSWTGNCLPCELFVYTFLIPGSFKCKKIPLFELALNNTPKTFNGLWRRTRAHWLTVPPLLCRNIISKCFSPSTLRLLPFLVTQKLHSQTPRTWGRVLLSHISQDLWDKGFFVAESCVGVSGTALADLNSKIIFLCCSCLLIESLL